jgi:hypothetical protein
MGCKPSKPKQKLPGSPSPANNVQKSDSKNSLSRHKCFDQRISDVGTELAQKSRLNRRLSNGSNSKEQSILSEVLSSSPLLHHHALQTNGSSVPLTKQHDTTPITTACSDSQTNITSDVHDLVWAGNFRAAEVQVRSMQSERELVVAPYVLLAIAEVEFWRVTVTADMQYVRHLQKKTQHSQIDFLFLYFRQQNQKK